MTRGRGDFGGTLAPIWGAKYPTAGRLPVENLPIHGEDGAFTGTQGSPC
jgi:hypothetical protein